MPAKKPIAKPAKSAKAGPAKKASAKLPVKSASKMTAKPVPKSATAKKPVAAKSSAKAPQGKVPIAKVSVAPVKPVAKATAKASREATTSRSTAPQDRTGAIKAPDAPIVQSPTAAAIIKPLPRSARPDGPIAIATSSRSSRLAPETTENDDGDGSDQNLLTGPRNVTPYIAKRGELYMSKEQLEHFRQILGSWKSDLMREVDRTVSHMKDEAANFPDPNDRATQEEEFSLELRTRDRERKLIRKIDEALQRIEDGSYGYCLETGEEIGIKRLEARPVATLCLEAQERRERREKQYGDRDDRYR